MANQTDDGGGSGGGGSTTMICTINPSDNVSVLNNLLSRIADIERFLSYLVGADVHANNLSELAENIGNILNGTITLPGDGNSPWAGEGGSIPVPDDFSGTVISGNTTVIWENGVVSFQVDNSGIVTGGGGVGSNALVSIQATANAITSVTEVQDTGGIISISGNNIIITATGRYLFAMDDQIFISTTAAHYGLLQLSDPSFSLAGQPVVCEAGQVTGGSTSGSKFARLGTTNVVTIPSGSFTLTPTASSSGGTWNHTAQISILKLS